MLKSRQRILAESAQAGLACADRRMKLFAAAERLGAELVDENGWIAAVCRKSEQCHPFGRTKPPVIPGTNTIDPECNLEDWEGISPEARRRRDDASGRVERVKDGIGYDVILPVSGQTSNVGCAESAWCLCGTLSGHYGWNDFPSPGMFDFYTAHGRNPIVVFMSKKTGRMYMYANSQGHEEFANEQDTWDGNYGSGNQPAVQMKWMKTKFMPENPDFCVVFGRILEKYFPEADAAGKLEGWDEASKAAHDREMNGENV